MFRNLSVRCNVSPVHVIYNTRTRSYLFAIELLHGQSVSPVEIKKSSWSKYWMQKMWILFSFVYYIPFRISLSSSWTLIDETVESFDWRNIKSIKQSRIRRYKLIEKNDQWNLFDEFHVSCSYKSLKYLQNLIKERNWKTSESVVGKLVKTPRNRRKFGRGRGNHLPWRYSCFCRDPPSWKPSSETLKLVWKRAL